VIMINGSALEIKTLTHFYGSTAALKDVSLKVNQREVLALLGPSGSGKSTLLSVIAGIVTPSKGKILLDGRNLLELPTESRGLGMVFQDFSLWPHMTVAQNVAFPLRARKSSPSEVAIRTDKALARVGLDRLAARWPHELSGGQQQRVALARAVVADTRLLLLDEPLSALDPATRSSVRRELAEILRRLELTTIIVTHDRDEAFQLADKIAVLVDGELRQVAGPEEVYERPEDLTVARFMGANLIAAHVLGDNRIDIDDGAGTLTLASPATPGPVHLAIVPEQVQITENQLGENTLRAHLISAQYCGGEYRLQLRIGAGQTIEARSKIAPAHDVVFVRLPAETIHVIQKSPPAESVATADPLSRTAVTTKLQEEFA